MCLSWRMGSFLEPGSECRCCFCSFVGCHDVFCRITTVMAQYFLVPCLRRWEASSTTAQQRRVGCFLSARGESFSVVKYLQQSRVWTINNFSLDIEHEKSLCTSWNIFGIKSAAPFCSRHGMIVWSIGFWWRHKRHHCFDRRWKTWALWAAGWTRSWTGIWTWTRNMAANTRSRHVSGIYHCLMMCYLCWKRVPMLSFSR